MATTPPESNTAQTVLMTQIGDGNALRPAAMLVLPKDHKPFRCGMCTVSFNVNKDLVVHVQAHFVNKPYQCGYCMVSYESNVDLLSHVKVHKLFLCLPSDSLPVSSHTDPVGQGKDTEVCGQHGPGMTTHTQGEDKGGETETRTNCTVLKGRTLSSDCQQTADNVSQRTEEDCADDDSDDNMSDDDRHSRIDDQLKEGDSDQPTPDALVSVKKEIHEDHHSCDHTGRNSGLPQSLCSTETPHDLSTTQRKNSTDFLASSVTANSEDQCNTSGPILPDIKLEYQCPEPNSGSRQSDVRKGGKSPNNVEKESHKSQDTSLAYRCGECDAVFPSILALTHHWDSCHSACTVCSERFPDPMHLQVHLKSEHGEDKGRKYRPFLCGLCGADFMVAKYLPPHIKDVHKVQLSGPDISAIISNKGRKVKRNPKDSVPHSGRGIIRKKKVSSSISKADSTKVFDCPVCPEQYKSKSQLKAHAHSMHSTDGFFKCPLCEKTFRELYRLKKHYEMSHVGADLKPHQCPQCSKTFKWPHSLRNHIEVKHNPDNGLLQCPECDKTFKWSEYLKRHIESMHNPARALHHCPVCNKTFRWLHHLKNHLKVIHNPDSDNSLHQCPECDKTFQWQRSLKNHIEACHSEGESPYQCPTCGRSFKYQTSLIRHVSQSHSSQSLSGTSTDPSVVPRDGQKIGDQTQRRSASRIKPKKKKNVCHICGKAVINVSQHLSRIHSDVRPHKCSLCDRAYKTNRVLEIHMRTHTKEKPYMCETCGKSFAQKNTLTCHRNTHTNAKPYRCELCDRGFNAPSALAIHRRRHRGDKRHMCDICGMKFFILNNLRRHALTHTDQRPWSCNKCGKTYRSPSSLQYHMVHSHNVT